MGISRSSSYYRLITSLKKAAEDPDLAILKALPEVLN